MQLHTTSQIPTLHTSHIVIPAFKGKLFKSALLDSIGDEERVYVEAMVKDLDGAWLDTRMVVLSGKKTTKVLVVGLGEYDRFTSRKLALAARKIVTSAKATKLASFTVSIEDFPCHDMSRERISELMAINFQMAHYVFTRYKEQPKGEYSGIDQVSVYTPKADSLEGAIEIGSIIGEHVNAARELVNVPGGDMTPTMLSHEAKKVGDSFGVEVKVLGEKEMGKLGMGGILGVSRGSVEEAKFIIMEYLHGSKTQKPLVFAGKGITFDSGGLHIKPSNSMDEMHMDMGGAASVIQAMGAIARLKLKINVIGLVSAAENMPSGQSFRPGDILTSMSGKTIEVASPDAEGRVVLADALTYALRYKPVMVVDVATLTGAVIVALGHHAMGYMTPSRELAERIKRVSERSGDYAWELPLWEEYEEDVRGSVGDVLNVGKNREAGAINGGMFLYQFAKEFPQWAHLDIASTMTTSSDQILTKGASGSGTRLLVELARDFCRELKVK